MYCAKCGAQVAEGVAFCAACGQPTSGGGAPGYAATAPAPQVPYAGFWLRFVAYIIDGFVLGIPFTAIIFILLAATGALGVLQHINPGEPPDAAAALLGVGVVAAFVGVVLLSIVGGWLYFGWTESSTWQATLGKRALGLYVTDMNGQRCSFGRASGRFFAKFITGLIPLAIGYIMAGFTDKKQALHDMIASCLVLRKA